MIGCHTFNCDFIYMKDWQFGAASKIMGDITVKKKYVDQSSSRGEMKNTRCLVRYGY